MTEISTNVFLSLLQIGQYSKIRWENAMQFECVRKHFARLCKLMKYLLSICLANNQLQLGIHLSTDSFVCVEIQDEMKFHVIEF